jgi:hypothetical protein
MVIVHEIATLFLPSLAARKGGDRSSYMIGLNISPLTGTVELLYFIR